jgi:hypothetical protein
MTDETFLAQHRATLVRDQDGWLLRYPIQDRSLYEEKRFNPPIEATIPLVGETREDSLQIAELLLRDHKPPKILAEPATEQPTPLTKFARRRSIDPKRFLGSRYATSRDFHAGACSPE